MPASRSRWASNVGEGQVVWVIALPEHAPLARAIARVAYESGASYVDVDYTDQHVRRARIQHAEEDTLDWTPPWVLEQDRPHLRAARRPDRRSSATRSRSCSPTSTARVSARRGCEAIAERYVKAMNRRLINWTIVAYPNEGWATDGLRRAGRRTALGRRRRRRRGSTSPTRSRPGAPTSTSWSRARGAPERARASTPSGSADRAPTSRSA